MSETRNSAIFAVYPEKGNLVRFAGGKAELYCPNNPEVWVELPHLMGILSGCSGDAIWYDFIDENEAKKWMATLKDEHAKAKVID